MSGNLAGPTNANQIVVPAIAFLIVSPIIVILRLWCRLRNRGGLGPDDYTVIVAMVRPTARPWS
jgi:hypothetical protein